MRYANLDFIQSFRDIYILNAISIKKQGLIFV